MSGKGFSFRRVQHLLIDLDGVLYRGNTALPDAQRFIGWLDGEGIDYRLVSNNATMTPPEYVDKLRAMDIVARPDDIFSSALATALYLKKQGSDRPTAYVIGQDGLRAALEQSGITITDQHPHWVVVGLDRGLTYEKLATASLLIEGGATFIGANPDTSFPTQRGLEPGAGALLAAITATTGNKPLIVGKPEPLMFELAMQQMGATPSNTAVLGDRLDTDILGAVRLELPSILILTGVSTRQELQTSSVCPDLVVDDLASLMTLWETAI